jgi:hypothetical protein
VKTPQHKAEGKEKDDKNSDSKQPHSQTPAASPPPASPSIGNSTNTNSSVDAIGAATVNVTALELLNLTTALNATAGGNTSNTADATGGESFHC